MWWSIARYDLGISERDFYALNPRKLDALLKRREHEREHGEYMLAQIAAVTANFSMGRPKKPLKTRDFMPSKWEKPTRTRRPSQKKIAWALNIIFGVTHKEPECQTDSESKSTVNL